MKILITGASGLVGSRFVELYSSKYELLTPEYPAFNLLEKAELEKYFDENRPETTIHFAAYTDVGGGEKQRGDKNRSCWQTNVQAVQNILDCFKSSHLIHISTDMVFPGSAENPGPYAEDAVPETDSNKLNWYGFTKAEGERLVREKFGDKTTILRLIYPVRAKYDLKPDYLRKPLQQYDEGKLLPLFSDQQVSISFVDEICIVIDKIIATKTAGIYHASSSDTATPLELVSYLLLKTRHEPGPLKSWSIDEFFATGASPVRYPKFGGLSVKGTEEKLKMKFSTWREIIDKLVEQGITA